MASYGHQGGYAFNEDQRGGHTPVDIEQMKKKANEIEDKYLTGLLGTLTGIPFIVADESTMPYFNQNSYMLIIGKKLAEKLRAKGWQP